jgi:hypothetical protein
MTPLATLAVSSVSDGCSEESTLKSQNLRSNEVGKAATKNGRIKRRNVVCILDLKVVQRLEDRSLSKWCFSVV